MGHSIRLANRLLGLEMRRKFLFAMLSCSFLTTLTTCGNVNSTYTIEGNPPSYAIEKSSLGGDTVSNPEIFYRFVVKDTNGTPIPSVDVDFSAQLGSGQLFDENGDPVNVASVRDETQTTVLTFPFTVKTNDNGFVDLYVSFSKSYSFKLPIVASVGGHSASVTLEVTDSGL